MPKPLSPPFFSHWHKGYDGFQTSALEFYSSVEVGLERRQIPGLSMSHVVFHEGGALSARREYLRVRRQRLNFDLCAAPFGTGFFFSWWCGVRRASRWLLLVVLAQIGLAIYLTPMIAHAQSPGGYQRGRAFQSWSGSLTQILIGIGVFIVLGILTRFLSRLWDGEPDDTVVVIPVIGPLYERLFKPNTYFRTDTITMFQDMVRTAVNEAIDGVTTAKGLRALSEDEKKPIMRDFLRR